MIIVALVALWTGTVVLLRDGKRSHGLKRAALTTCAGVTAGLLSWRFWSVPQPQFSDLAQVWAGARALWHHGNPYEAVGPGRAFEWPMPVLYPLTAMLAVLPFAALPLRWLDPLFVAASFGLFTWAVTKRESVNPALVGVISLPALMAVQTSQWSPLLTGAALVPAFGGVLIAKPTIGLALFAAFPHWKTALGCAVLLLISVLVWPRWITAWRATFASAPHVIAPVMRPGGLLVLAAALKWKRPEARLLLGLACVPHTTALYETIPLFLVPLSWVEAWALWSLALLAYAAQWWAGPYDNQMAYWASGAQWIVWLMYLPCTAMVLRRPNRRPEPYRYAAA